MTGAAALFEDSVDWVQQLPAYQQELVRQLLAGGAAEEEAAAHWLTANLQNLAPFGGEARARTLFFRKFLDEVHDFLCSDGRYGKEREEVVKQFSLGQTSAVTGISLALAGPLAAASPFLAPAVALILVTVSKMGLNAWCAMMTERRTTSEGPKEPA